MRVRHRTLTVYSVGHFLVDLACMFLFMRCVAGTHARLYGALIYNLLAFAGQLPLGLLADRWGHGRAFAALGCLCVAASYLLGSAPYPLCVTAGVGNAMFHIGGGLDTLNRSEGRAGPLGIFVSPGAFGLFLGGLFARGGLPLPVPAAALVLTALAIRWLCDETENAPLSLAADGAATLAALLLFLVVALRSYMGFLFSFPWKTGALAWLFTAGVVGGKALGGFCLDRFGGARTALFSLGLASALFPLSGWPVCGVAAVLLFNMTMPVTLRAAADLFPGAKGFSFGLLTCALFLGFLPEYLGLPALRTGWMYALLALVSLALLWLALPRKRP